MLNELKIQLELVSFIVTNDSSFSMYAVSCSIYILYGLGLSHVIIDPSYLYNFEFTYKHAFITHFSHYNSFVPLCFQISFLWTLALDLELYLMTLKKLFRRKAFCLKGESLEGRTISLCLTLLLISYRIPLHLKLSQKQP